MKAVDMVLDFYYSPHRKIAIYFKAGVVYFNVPDEAAAAIAAAGAGTVYDPVPEPPGSVNASTHAKRMRIGPGYGTWHQTRPGPPSNMRQPNRASKPGSKVFH